MLISAREKFKRNPLVTGLSFGIGSLFVLYVTLSPNLSDLPIHYVIGLTLLPLLVIGLPVAGMLTIQGFWKQAVIAIAALVVLLLLVPVIGAVVGDLHVDDSCDAFERGTTAEQFHRTVTGIDGDRENLITVSVKYCGPPRNLLVMVNASDKNSLRLGMGIGDHGGRLQPIGSSIENRDYGQEVLATDSGKIGEVAIGVGNTGNASRFDAFPGSDIRNYANRYNCSIPMKSPSNTLPIRTANGSTGSNPCREKFGNARLLTPGDAVEVYQMSSVVHGQYAVPGELLFRYRVR